MFKLSSVLLKLFLLVNIESASLVFVVVVVVYPYWADCAKSVAIECSQVVSNEYSLLGTQYSVLATSILNICPSIEDGLTALHNLGLRQS